MSAVHIFFCCIQLLRFHFILTQSLSFEHTDSLVLKCYSMMLNRQAYRFHSNRQCDCDPMLVFELKRANNDQIGVNELIDSHANTIPVKCLEENKKKRN